jgi:hypothetical protein
VFIVCALSYVTEHCQPRTHLTFSLQNISVFQREHHQTTRHVFRRFITLECVIFQTRKGEINVFSRKRRNIVLSIFQSKFICFCETITLAKFLHLNIYNLQAQITFMHGFAVYIYRLAWWLRLCSKTSAIESAANPLYNIISKSIQHFTTNRFFCKILTCLDAEDKSFDYTANLWNIYTGYIYIFWAVAYRVLDANEHFLI